VPPPHGRRATPDRALAFLACPPEHVEALLGRLDHERPGVEWDVVGLSPPDVAWSSRTRFLQSTGGLGFAVRLWLRVARERYAVVVVCASDLARPEALGPLLRYVALLPVARRRLIDRFGAARTLDRAGVADVLAAVATPALLLLARLVTRLGLAIVAAEASRPRTGSARPGPAAPSRGGRTALVVPILPDLSHTFVYREVLALARRHPDWEVLVLERGSAPVLHREAREVEALARYVPRRSPNRYLVTYLGFWLSRPRAMARLIRTFAPHTATFAPDAPTNDSYVFLRLPYLDHSNHLAPGLVFADHLRRSNIASIHVYGSTYPSIRALVAERLLGVSMSLSTFVDYEYPTPFHMLREKVETARFVTVCSAFCRDRLAGRFPDLASRFRVVRPSLPDGYGDAPAFRPADTRSRLVFVGRFVPKKGVDTLVAAVDLLRARGILGAPGVDPVCRLYGAGEEEDALRALVRRWGLDAHVAFEGPIANEDFYSTMSLNDVFVTPSRPMPDGERDGIPVALIEAMAAGVTVVSTRVSGIPELVEDGENGYLVPPDDPEALAKVLEWVLTTPAARARVRDAARRTVRARFALGPAADRLDAWISRETTSGA
jgi:glycosyltransferase involved in cell wall biosynthesis